MTDGGRAPGLLATFGASALMSALILWTALMLVSFDAEAGSICFGGGGDEAPACPAAPCHALCSAGQLKPKKLPTD